MVLAPDDTLLVGDGLGGRGCGARWFRWAVEAHVAAQKRDLSREIRNICLNSKRFIYSHELLLQTANYELRVVTAPNQ
jgi:hypothetical protein